MAKTADIVIIGAGMAGASAACRLAEAADVILLEAEDQPGYHSTGRSAAMFVENYGNSVIRVLTRAGRDFFRAPPDGFTDLPLLGARGTLAIAGEDQLDHLEGLLREGEGGERLTSEAVVAIVPILRQDRIVAGVLQAGDTSIDVDALHQGFLRGFAACKGRRFDKARVIGLERAEGCWTIATSSGSFAAPVVVNAAGAWADQVAVLAGLAPLGLKPLRRTALIIDVPEDRDASVWPLVFEASESFYFRPEAGLLLLSPANEDPVEPCDVQPEELDIAVAIDRFETATGHSVPKVHRAWAGLRTFAPDKTPVAGFDPEGEGFFWLAGQGGYGIQTAPALSRVARGMILEAAIPSDLMALGLGAEDLDPARFK